jgi:hypothetical protein
VRGRGRERRRGWGWGSAVAGRSQRARARAKVSRPCFAAAWCACRVCAPGDQHFPHSLHACNAPAPARVPWGPVAARTSCSEGEGSRRIVMICACSRCCRKGRAQVLRDWTQMRKPPRRRRTLRRAHVGGAHSSEVAPVAGGRRHAHISDVAPEKSFLRCKTGSNPPVSSSKIRDTAGTHEYLRRTRFPGRLMHEIVECDHSTPKNSISSPTSVQDPKGGGEDHPIRLAKDSVHKEAGWPGSCGFASRQMTRGKITNCGAFVPAEGHRKRESGATAVGYHISIAKVEPRVPSNCLC